MSQGTILFIGSGCANPAMDMAFHGFLKLGWNIIEYPIIEHRHNNDYQLASTGIPAGNLYSIAEIKRRDLNLILMDVMFENSTNIKEATTLLEMDVPFCVIDQTGVNRNIDWDSPPYHGRIPICKFSRVKPNINRPEKQEVLLMSTRRDWKGPRFDNFKTKYLSVFMGCLYQTFHDAHYRRKLLHDVLDDFPGVYFNQNFRFGNLEYFEIIAQSLSAVTIKGMVWDSWRFWEILNVGSCLIAENMDKVIDFNPPFISGEHYLDFNFQFDNESPDPIHVAQQLKDRLQFVNDNSEEANKIAKQGYEFASKHHSSVNRAEQILKILT